MAISFNGLNAIDVYTQVVRAREIFRCPNWLPLSPPATLVVGTFSAREFALGNIDLAQLSANKLPQS